MRSSSSTKWDGVGFARSDQKWYLCRLSFLEEQRFQQLNLLKEILTGLGKVTVLEYTVLEQDYPISNYYVRFSGKVIIESHFLFMKE